ncbi:MAG: NAD(P)-dependent oxidoreductase [Caldilineaceae bacterium]
MTGAGRPGARTRIPSPTTGQSGAVCAASSTPRWVSSASGRRGTGSTPAAHAAGAVLYHKRTRLPASVEAELSPTPPRRCSLAASDILCCLLPYSAATDMSLNAAVFAALPPGRAGRPLRQRQRHRRSCLAHALRGGHLGGAALDTFEWEPLLLDNPLLALARDPAMNVLPRRTRPRDGRRRGRAGDYVHVVRALADGHAS